MARHILIALALGFTASYLGASSLVIGLVAAVGFFASVALANSQNIIR